MKKKSLTTNEIISKLIWLCGGDYRDFQHALRTCKTDKDGAVWLEDLIDHIVQLNTVKDFNVKT